MNARHLPEERARILTWARDQSRDGMANYLAVAAGMARYRNRSGVGATPDEPVQTDHDPVAQAVADAQRLARQLPAAELFYVTADMARVAEHAATSLSDYRPHPADLPAPIGLLVFAEPLPHVTTYGAEPITMITWGPSDTGLTLDYWATFVDLKHALQPNPDSDEDLIKALPAGREPPQRRPLAAYARTTGTHLTFAKSVGESIAVPSEALTETDRTLQRTIIATWLLMGQTITTSTSLVADRPARRRIARVDPDLSTRVRLIELRRAHTTSTISDRAGTRAYQHRWVVRGHWRNQWYASRNQHRPIWIADHIPGPEDKQLLGGHRVNILRR